MRDVYQGQQARELNGAQSSLISNLYRDLVVEPRRRAQAWCAIIGPENADKRLLFRPLRPRGATQVFHFVVCSRVSRAGHIGRRRRAELTRRADHERKALAPVRTQGERDQADWILPPVAGLIAGEIIDADGRIRNLRTIVETHRENGCGGSMAQIDSVCSLMCVGDGS